MPLLSWFQRDEDLTRAALAPYRLLEPVKSLNYGEVDSPNMLIEGDNLDALKALLPYYAGQVKCVFIDPPYNTMSAFEHYDDNLEQERGQVHLSGVNGGLSAPTPPPPRRTPTFRPAVDPKPVSECTLLVRSAGFIRAGSGSPRCSNVSLFWTRV